jgi:hypothetical protein
VEIPISGQGKLPINELERWNRRMERRKDGRKEDWKIGKLEERD